MVFTNVACINAWKSLLQDRSLTTSENFKKLVRVTARTPTFLTYTFLHQDL